MRDGDWHCRVFRSEVARTQAGGMMSAHRKRIPDPIEQIVRDGLEKSRLAYVEEDHPDALGLDFYLPFLDIHIEVKQFHTDRISEQMSRAPNVIAIQGRDAATLFAELLKSTSPVLCEDVKIALNSARSSAG